MSILLQVLLVASLIEKLVQILHVVNLQLDEPALAQRGFVDLARVALQLLHAEHVEMSISFKTVVQISNVPS